MLDLRQEVWIEVAQRVPRFSVAGDHPAAGDHIGMCGEHGRDINR